MKRSLTLITLLAFGALTLAASAGAVVLAGRGELHARGSGLAILDVRGTVTVRGAGTVTAHADDVVEAVGHGRETDLGDGRVLYEGFGAIVVRNLDHRTRVKIAGTALRLHAKGRGVALLRGCGQFETRDVDGEWAPDLELEFDSDA